MSRNNIIKVPKYVFQANRLKLSTVIYKLEAFETSIALGTKPSREDWLYLLALYRQWRNKIRN